MHTTRQVGLVGQVKSNSTIHATKALAKDIFPIFSRTCSCFLQYHPITMHLTFMRHPEIPQRMASSFASSLVLSSRSLAGFQLVQVPTANSQITLILIHAVPEVADISRASTVLCRVICSRATLPQAAVHGLGRGRSLLRLSGSAGRRTAREKASDGVSDRGTDCYTSCGRCHLAEEARSGALLDSRGRGRGRRRRGMMLLLSRICSCRVRLRVLLSVGSSSRSSGCRSRSGGSAACRSGGSTAALTSHINYSSERH